MFCVLGDWERALVQLNVVRDMDAEALPMVQTYQELLHCEALRSQVFAGQRTPLLLGQPEPWMATLLEATRLTGIGQMEQADVLRQQAFETADTTAGLLTCRSTPDSKIACEWIADADSRLGPMLEAMINGKYFWVPWNRIETIDIEPPSDLRDFVWCPAKVAWTNGGHTVAFIPTRYPQTTESADDQLKLARRTEWVPLSENAFRGLGQRVLTTDQEDFPLLDVARWERAAEGTA